MNDQVIWMLMVALAVGVGLLVARRRVRDHVTPTARTAWLVAAVTSGTMLVFMASVARDAMPRITTIDLAAIAVTGVLTGVFLAFGVLRPR